MRHVPLFLVALTLSSAARSAEPIALQLGEPEPLPRQLHSFNSNLLTATAFNGITYGAPEFAAGLRDLQPAGLRFPGGTTANNYLWQEDSFSLQNDDRTEWAAQQLALFRKIGRKYDLPGYARICRDFNLAPIWVLNIYEETPESVVALLDHLDKLGLKLAAIEMGNEPYWDPRSLMNVRQYSEFCRPLAAAIRAHRPEIHLAGPGIDLLRGFATEGNDGTHLLQPHRHSQRNRIVLHPIPPLRLFPFFCVFFVFCGPLPSSFAANAATGHIHLKEINGRTWLIAPNGKPFFAHGITHIGTVKHGADYATVAKACKERSKGKER